MPLPRIAHRIWIGSAPNEEQIGSLLDTRQHIRGHVDLWLWTNRSNRPRLPVEIDNNIKICDLDTLWTGCSIPGVPLAHLHSAFERERHGYFHNYAAASDIARLLILYRYGGVYFDMDVSFDEDVIDLFGALGNLGQRLGVVGRVSTEFSNSVLAAMPRAKSVEKCLSAIVYSYRSRRESWGDKRGFMIPILFRVGITMGMTGPDLLNNTLSHDKLMKGIPYYFFKPIDMSAASYTTPPKIKRRDSLP